MATINHKRKSFICYTIFSNIYIHTQAYMYITNCGFLKNNKNINYLHFTVKNHSKKKKILILSQFDAYA